MQQTDLPSLELKTDNVSDNRNDWFDRLGWSGILLIAGLLGLGLIYKDYLQKYNGAVLTERNSKIIIEPAEILDRNDPAFIKFRIEDNRAILLVTGSAYDLIDENKEAKEKLLSLKTGDMVSVKTVSTDDYLTNSPSETIQVIGIKAGRDIILDPQKLIAVNREERNKYLWIAGLITGAGLIMIIYKFFRKMASKEMWEQTGDDLPKDQTILP